MNPHEWLADYIKDMNSLHTAMIGVGVLITVICFKTYVPEFAKDTELAVKGWIRLVIAAGLVTGFGSFSEITGEGFDGLATYINPNWQTGNSTTFMQAYRSISAKGSNDAGDSRNQQRGSGYFGKWAQTIADNIYAALITAFMNLLTWLALAMMFFLEIAHTVLLNAEYAVIPAFMGFIANPSTAHLAHGFLISFLGIQMWVPVYSLVCRVNDSLIRGAFTGLYHGQQPVFDVFGAAGAVAPILGSFALFGFFALWVFFTLRMVPTIANKLVRGEGFASGLAEGGWKAVESAMGHSGKAFKSGGKAAMDALEAMGERGGSKGGGHSHSGSHGSGGDGGSGSSPLLLTSSPPPFELGTSGDSGSSAKRLSSSPPPKRLESSDANNPYSSQNRQKTLETQQAKLLELNSRVMEDGSLALSF